MLAGATWRCPGRADVFRIRPPFLLIRVWAWNSEENRSPVELYFSQQNRQCPAQLRGWCRATLHYTWTGPCERVSLSLERMSLRYAYSTNPTPPTSAPA